MLTLPSRAASATVTTPRLNFVVVGDVRSGTSVVADVVNNHGLAVCHAGLFAERADARRAAHENYFGPCHRKKPEWFCLGDRELEGGKHSHPYEYIDDLVLRSALYGEQVVGLCLPYSVVAKFELYDFLTGLARRGDFCVVHVVRNPVVCLASYEQARANDYWVSYDKDCKRRYSPMPVAVEPERVVDFVRRHCAVRDKVAAAVDDAVEVHYADLVNRFDRVAARLFQFLELPSRRPVCRTRRLVRVPLPSRLVNYAALLGSLPSQVRHWFNESEPV